MIIDFHTHAFADFLAPKALPKLAELCNIKPYTTGTLESVKGSMKDADIDYSVVANIATNPKQMQNVNKWAIENNSLPFIQFGSIHPDSPDWEQELELLKQSGIKGIKLHPDYQDFFVDDEKMFPIYRKIVELDFVLLFHSGYDVGLHNPVHCTPKGFYNVMEKIDTSKFVLAHMGGFKEQEDFIKLIAGQPFYIDTAFSLCDKLSLEALNASIEAHGVDKVLFATDSPWASQKAYVDYIKSNFDQATQNKIFSENAKNLLDL